jgi:fructokinase
VITIIGEAIIDLVHTEGKAFVRSEPASGAILFAAHPGGSPLNVAVGLARLDRPTAMMARFAGDAFGRILRNHAESNDVDVSAAVPAAEHATLAVVTLDGEGRATYDFYWDGTADWQWTDAELAALPAGTEILHTGSLAAWTEPGADRIAALMERMRTDVLVSYDPNVRPKLLGTPEKVRPMVARSVAAAHVVKASDDDVRWLYPDEQIDDVARRWVAAGPELVVITRGAAGASAFTKTGLEISRPGIPIQLVDTVGAGDAFTAGLLDGLASGGFCRPGALAGISGSRLAEIIDRAILAAAITCERPGADPPTRSALDDASSAARRPERA